MTELYLIGGLFLVLGAAILLIEKYVMPPDITCHCDHSNQGRECKDCKAK